MVLPELPEDSWIGVLSVSLAEVWCFLGQGNILYILQFSFPGSVSYIWFWVVSLLPPLGKRVPISKKLLLHRDGIGLFPWLSILLFFLGCFSVLPPPKNMVTWLTDNLQWPYATNRLFKATKVLSTTLIPVEIAFF